MDAQWSAMIWAMGSFTELTLAFTFSSDVPQEVVGAFAQWRTGNDGPELPAFDEALDPNDFAADEFLGDWFDEGPPPVGSLPLLQRAALWRYVMEWGSNAYFPGTPATTLRWDRYGERWKLTTRTLPKDSREWVQSIIAPLGELAEEGSQEQPRFLGYLLDEESPQPVLIWGAGREPFRFQELVADA
jgi:hypothetical protein